MLEPVGTLHNFFHRLSGFRIKISLFDGDQFRALTGLRGLLRLDVLLFTQITFIFGTLAGLSVGVERDGLLALHGHALEVI